MAHTAICQPGSLSVVACPAQRQSGEAVRRVKECVIKAGGVLRTDNVYGIELDNGSRVMALPGSDDSIRGLTVDGWIVADEAARLSNELIAALRPMRARRPDTRFAMLSTAWSRTDPFWTAWDNDNPEWIRLRATAEIPGLYTEEYLAQERRELGEEAFKSGVSRHSRRQPRQPVHLGSVRAGDPDSRPVGAAGFGVCAAAGTVEHIENPFKALNTAGVFR